MFACSDSSGMPTFGSIEVDVTKEQIKNGEHYEMAFELAVEARYEEPFVFYDEREISEIVKAGLIANDHLNDDNDKEIENAINAISTEKKDAGEILSGDVNDAMLSISAKQSICLYQQIEVPAEFTEDNFRDLAERVKSNAHLVVDHDSYESSRCDCEFI